MKNGRIALTVNHVLYAGCSALTEKSAQKKGGKGLRIRRTSQSRPAVQDAVIDFGHPVHPQPACSWRTTRSILMKSPSSRVEPSRSP